MTTTGPVETFKDLLAEGLSESSLALSGGDRGAAIQEAIQYARTIGVEISPEFIVQTENLHALLEILTDRFEGRGINEIAFKDGRAVYTPEQTRVRDNADLYFPSIRDALAGFELEAKKLPEPSPETQLTIDIHRALAQVALLPVIEQGAFSRWMYTLPERGFAVGGPVISAILTDDDTLKGIIASLPPYKDLPIDSTTLAGEVWDQALRATPVARAHNPHRLDDVQLLVEHALTLAETQDKVVVTSVGSGVAKEFRDFVEAHRGDPRLEKIEFQMYDRSAEALAIVNGTLSALGANVVTHQVDLLNLPTNFRFEASDITVAGGFFDYIPRAKTEELIRSIKDSSNEGGYLFVAMVSPEHPHRYTQSVMFNWDVAYHERIDEFVTAADVALYTPLSSSPLTVHDQSPLNGLVDSTAVLQNPDHIPPGNAVIFSSTPNAREAKRSSGANDYILYHFK